MYDLKFLRFLYGQIVTSLCYRSRCGWCALSFYLCMVGFLPIGIHVAELHHAARSLRSQTIQANSSLLREESLRFFWNNDFQQFLAELVLFQKSVSNLKFSSKEEILFFKYHQNFLLLLTFVLKYFQDC